MALLNGREPRWWRVRAWLVLWLLLAGGPLGLHASPSYAQSREYQVKAAFLFNFARFVQWPEGAFAAPGDPIRIGVLGDDPFGEALDATVAGETVNDRKLVVRRSHDLEDLRGSHLLFISRSERERLAQILEALRAESVLTVGDIERFAHRGGGINLYLDDNRLGFEINLLRTTEQGLTLSSQLLSLGKIVRPRQGQGAD